MASPTLTPASTVSVSKLPPTGSGGDVTGSLAYGIYLTDNFINGAVDQVVYTYQKLGGEILDLELKAEQVYNAYEEAVLNILTLSISIRLRMLCPMCWAAPLALLIRMVS